MVQDTLSIDLTKSWTAESVDMHPISKRGLPFLNGQSLWPAKDNQSFYSFGGHVSLFGGDTDNVPGK